MDTVTYPTPEVVEVLNRDFVCFSVNTGDSGKEGRALQAEYRLLWQPGFVFFDPGGFELRRFVGFRPAARFLAELSFVTAMTAVYRRRYERAEQGFLHAAALAPGCSTAAEALYWRGIVVYRRSGGDREQLRSAWLEVRDHDPESSWWQAADVLDAVPTGVRQS